MGFLLQYLGASCDIRLLYTLTARVDWFELIA